MLKYKNLIKRCSLLLLIVVALFLGFFMYQQGAIFDENNYNGYSKEFLGENEQGLDIEENNMELSFENDNADSEKSIFFLGIYEGQIATYEKTPENEKILREVHPYPVKEVYEKDLREGIIFHNEEEKELILENLTS